MLMSITCFHYFTSKLRFASSRKLLLSISKMVADLGAFNIVPFFVSKFSCIKIAYFSFIFLFYHQSLVTVQDAILKLLRDDDLTVVLKAVTLDGISDTLSSSDLLKAFKDVLFRCIDILKSGMIVTSSENLLPFLFASSQAMMENFTFLFSSICY